MMDGLIAGRLYGAPEKRTDKAGRLFTVAKVRAATSEGENLFVNVIAFEPNACQALLVLGDGDAVSLAGSITPRVWTDKQGNTRPAMDMVAHRVLTAYYAQQRRQTFNGEPARFSDNERSVEY